MSDSARQALRRLCGAAGSGDLAALCDRADVQLLLLFGSARRLDADANDVDLAVRFEKGASHDVLRLLDQLYRLTGYEGFDVLTSTGLSSSRDSG